MEQEEFKILFTKYIQNTCSEEELKKLFMYFDSYSNSDLQSIEQEIENHFTPTDLSPITDKEQKVYRETEMKLFNHIRKDDLRRKNLRILKTYIRIAAACLLIGFAGLITYHSTKSKSGLNKNQHLDLITATTDILPGKEQATLTLGSGQTIDLNALETGQTVETEGVKIIKEDNGQLRYEFAEIENSVKQSHTISTPKGGRYQLTLADGSRVWLNSASKLTFPTSFAGNTREVNLIGEGYFEVAKNREKPFLVHTQYQLIEVTGTRFNVASYADDRRISTTLLEGQVIINELGANKEKIILKPGQKAILSPSKSSLRVESANIEEAISWKNGWFVFEDMTLKEILKKASRWYEIEIDYSTIPHSRFTGAIPMDVNLSKLIDILEKTSELTFEVDNNKLTVKKKPM